MNGAGDSAVAQTWAVASVAGPTVVEPLAGGDSGTTVEPHLRGDDGKDASQESFVTQQKPISAPDGGIATSEDGTGTAATAGASDRLPHESVDPSTSDTQAQAATQSALPAQQAATTATTTQVTAPAGFSAAPSGAGMVGTTVATLLLVIGFILLLAWLARRVPGIGTASNPALKVVGSLALGPRERVVVVDVGGTQLLLATGTGGTRTLHTLEQPLPVPAATTSPFAQVLAQQFGKKKP